MIATIIGQLDPNSAIFGSVSMITICIIVTSMIVKRRSRRSIDNDFALEKIKQSDATKLAMGQQAAKRDVEMAKLNQNLITSHREENNGDG